MKYNEKNKKICEVLGAKQFQQIVFALEKLKYRILEKICPNILAWYDKYYEKSLTRRLSQCSEEDKKKIIDEYRFSKLLFKKELIYKQNQNYHIDLENPTFFVNYLKFNRNVHIEGLKSNLIFMLLAIILKIIFNDSLVDLCNLVLIYNSLSLFINFQCINLQNYNLCRLESDEMKELLQKREKKIKDAKVKKYGEGMKVIGKTFEESSDIPTLEDILNNVKTNEEKKQLLLYLKKHLETLERKNEGVSKVKRR